jgi:predicted O-methyltransferase YrrM
MRGAIYYNVCQTAIGHAVMRRLCRIARRLGMLNGASLPIDALDLEHDATAALMQLWQRMHWSGADGMMPPEQLLAVYRCVCRADVKGNVVELGCWTGLTTCYLAAACRMRRSGRVFAVDTFAGTREGGQKYDAIGRYGGSTLPAFRENIQRAGVAEWVTAVIGDTADSVKHYPGGPIRALFIDADHSCEGVRRDFDAWSKWVAPGGVVIFHDYRMPEAGVARFVDEQLATSRSFELSPGEVSPNVFVATRRVSTPHSRSSRSVSPAGAAVASPTTRVPAR